MKYLILLLLLVGCSQEDTFVRVDEFYDDCKRIYENSDYSDFDVYVDFFKGEPRFRCTLGTDLKGHGTRYTHLYVNELAGMNLYINSRVKK